jgi:hypothetical protein
MEFKAFQVHTRMGGRNSAVILKNVVPGKIVWFRVSKTYIAQSVGAVQYLHQPVPDEEEAENAANAANNTTAKCAAAEGADADAAGTPEEPLRQEPWWRTHDHMCFESRAEAAEEMFGNDAAGEPRLEPVDSVLQAQR